MPRAIVILIMVIGAVRIADTRRTLSQTFDEPAHIAAGMEWLSEHRYRYESQHPPLARIATAVVPWLSGVRSTGQPEKFAEGSAILTSHGSTPRILSRARAGVIVFYILACWTAFLWGRWAIDEWAGILAAALVSFLSPILAHSALATTDMGLAATLFFAFYMWCRFLEAPSVARAAAVALSVSAAILSKFTAIPFFAAGALVIWARFLLTRERPAAPQTWRMWLLMPAVGFITIWALYWFSFAPVDPSTQPDYPKPVETTIAHAIQTRLPGIRIPAPELIWGLDFASAHSREGHTSYLLGEVRETGWWYFFPVVLAVKTPLPFLLLAIAGALFSMRRNWRVASSSLAALVILAGSMTASVNLGSRHILPVFLLLAIPAAFAVEALWRWRKIAAILPLLWFSANSILAHPDYLSWFNELAGSHPERILAESDLDWGQDLLQLHDVLEAKGNPLVNIAYFGTGDPGRYGISEFHWLPPTEQAHGWVAVSIHNLMFEPDKYRWLDGIPFEPVGRSMRLYKVP
jgi:4-amino-4-deoxy-L-arabinose transferase-like glycosyltransferase